MTARALRSSLAAAALLVAVGCPESPEPGPTEEGNGEPVAPADADVVLRVNDVEIRASEVEVVASGIAEAFPEYTPVHCRRVALRNVFLPRSAVAAVHAERRAEALRNARTCHESLQNDPVEDGIAIEQLRGSLAEMEVDLWLFARGLDWGEWSPPFEQIGRFRLVHLIELEEREERSLDVVTVRVVDFPYLPAGSTAMDVEAMIDAVRLEILDPTWKDAVPERFRYRMRGEED